MSPEERRAYNRRWRAENLEHAQASQREQQRRLYAQNPAPRQEAMMRYKYKRSLADYDRVLNEQGGGCAICGCAPEKTRLAWDHDHTCCPGRVTCGDCVRELVCGRCNRVVGALEAGTYAAHSAYIEKWKKK